VVIQCLQRSNWPPYISCVSNKECSPSVLHKTRHPTSGIVVDKEDKEGGGSQLDPDDELAHWFLCYLLSSLNAVCGD